jgi:hypothetical protein
VSIYAPFGDQTGRTCPQCGMFVYFGTMHSCSTAKPVTQPAWAQPIQWTYKHPFTLDLTCPCGATARAEAPTEEGVNTLAKGFYDAHREHSDSGVSL